ncbi:MAG TPA: OsmC family protein [Bacteroidia bacterium]
MERSAKVIWKGAGKDGTGTVTTQSKALENNPYAYNTRFENEKGTNPEELIAAAHASCFSMKLAFVLNEAGFAAEFIDVTAIVTLDVKAGAITESRLEVKAKIDKITPDKFDELAEKTKTDCPVSKALNMKISMQAQLVNEHLNS